MATLTNNTIPEKTIERLSEYRRTLLASHKQGITHIFRTCWPASTASRPCKCAAT